MKVVNTITMLTGTVMTSLGLLPLLLGYPYCNGCPNSGPSNVWQLIVMAVYESQGVLLLTGIALTLSSFIVMRRYRTSL